MKLILIRHGETDWVKAQRVQGHSDIPLNNTGHAQAARVARFVAPLRPTQLYTSQLARTRETARGIEATCQLSVTPKACLNEVSFGVWEGLTFQEVAAKYPEDLAQWQDSRPTFRPPEGESLEDLAGRVLPFLDKLLREPDDQTVCVVAHGGSIKVMLLHILHAPLESFWYLKQDAAAINIVEGNHLFACVSLLNYTEHLNGRSAEEAAGTQKAQ